MIAQVNYSFIFCLFLFMLFLSSSWPKNAAVALNELRQDNIFAPERGKKGQFARGEREEE